jgi:predicted house-cleaning noncanonical NTP pyrophosphatase (MazG superfamily)
MVLPSKGKLVRDRIPQVIEASGGIPQWLILERNLWRPALNEKLKEEVAEYLGAVSEDSRLEELADVLEVVRGLLAETGLSLGDLLSVADAKRTERGGFEQGVWLT